MKYLFRFQFNEIKWFIPRGGDVHVDIRTRGFVQLIRCKVVNILHQVPYYHVLSMEQPSLLPLHIPVRNSAGIGANPSRNMHRQQQQSVRNNSPCERSATPNTNERGLMRFTRGPIELIYCVWEFRAHRAVAQQRRSVRAVFKEIPGTSGVAPRVRSHMEESENPGADFSRQQRGQGEPRPFHPRRFGETSDEDSAVCVCFFFFSLRGTKVAPHRGPACAWARTRARVHRVESAIGVRRSDDRRPRSRTQHRRVLRGSARSGRRTRAAAAAAAALSAPLFGAYRSAVSPPLRTPFAALSHTHTHPLARARERDVLPLLPDDEGARSAV